MIDIDHCEAQRLPVAAGTRAGVFEQLKAVRMVVKAGQAVSDDPGFQAAGPLSAGANRGNQMAGFDRFGQKIIAAFVHRVELLVEVVFGREINDGHADVALMLPDHFGQFSTHALGHVHVEDDQIRLEFSQVVDRLDRLIECLGDDPRVVQYPFSVCRLSSRVIDDQDAEGFVVCSAGEDFDFFQKARRIDGACEELQPSGAHGRQSHRCVGFLMAEENQRQLLFQPLLNALGKPQAFTGPIEVHIHDDRGRVPLMHRCAEFPIAGESLRIHAEEFELANHVLGALVVFQCDVDGFAQRRYVRRLPTRIAMAQPRACKTVDQLAEGGDGVAGQSSAIVTNVA